MGAQVVLLAGASGSGKTSLCRRIGVPVLALDHFYRDGDDPHLPHRFGIVDWDHPDSWDAAAALDALIELCRSGSAEVPEYDSSQSRRTGSARLHLTGASVIVAEGIFAPELVEPCRAAGLLADALCLRTHPAVTFVRRLARDLAQARKPPPTLIRRGLGLARDEPDLIERWVAAGCRPVTLTEAEAVLVTLLDGTRE